MNSSGSRPSLRMLQNSSKVSLHRTPERRSPWPPWTAHSQLGLPLNRPPLISTESSTVCGDRLWSGPGGYGRVAMGGRHRRIRRRTRCTRIPNRGDVLVYPANFVAKRWERRESNFLEDALRRIVHGVQKVASQWQASL